MSGEYHKIQTVFRRDLSLKHKPLIEGVWTLPEFKYLKDNRWTFTEKVDGTNIRVMYDQNSGVSFGGKADGSQLPVTLVNRLGELFGDLEKLSSVGESFTLYGEGYGAKIQKGGGNYRSDQDFVLFDVRVGEWWLRRDDVNAIADALGIDAVPIIGSGTLLDAIAMTKSGFTSQWGDFAAEGIVARPETELFTRGGQRIIAKIKTRDFGAKT